MEYKYTVLTAIYGGYEPLRDPGLVNTAAEYVCVTDDENLKSDVWKIIVDKEKTFLDVKHDPFAYASTDMVLWLDASYRIKRDPTVLVNDFIRSKKDMAISLHGERHNALEEACQWYVYRNLGGKQLDAFIKFFVASKVKSSVLFQTSCILMRNTERVKLLWENVRLVSKTCSVEKMYRDDQSIISMVFDKMDFGEEHVMLMDFLSVAHNSIWDWKEHGSDRDQYYFDIYDQQAFGKDMAGKLHRIK